MYLESNPKTPTNPFRSIESAMAVRNWWVEFQTYFSKTSFKTHRTETGRPDGGLLISLVAETDSSLRGCEIDMDAERNLRGLRFVWNSPYFHKEIHFAVLEDFSLRSEHADVPGHFLNMTELLRAHS